jgi:hypothetical protein
MTLLRTLPGLAFNVPSIARKSAEDVSKILGRPDKSGGTYMGGKLKQTYRHGAVEVVFVDGEAHWIKLHDTRGLPFGRDALAKLGLPDRKPTYVNRDRVMSWGNISNLKEVSLYAGNGGVSFVLVCVESKD